MADLPVAASGLVSEFTGIGVVQRALYPRLESMGFTVRLTASRDKGTKPLERVAGFVVGLTQGARSGEILVNTVNPFPVRGSKTSVVIVYDLQWRSTKNLPHQLYHAWDLRRTLRRATEVVVISDRVAADVREFAPSLAHKVRVAYLGPGLIEDPQPSRVVEKDNVALLIGGAEHKRNSVAAAVLSCVAGQKVDGVVGVGVSPQVKRELERSFGEASCRWLSNVGNGEMIDTISRARYYLHFGKEEGFGLPYLEALTSGAVVVALDQPVTRELLGEAAILLPDGEPADMAAAWSAASEPSRAERFAHADQYNWDTFAQAVAASIRVAGRR